MKLNKEQLEKDIETIFDMANRYHDIVWEVQEAQENHFDRIPKVEQVAIIGIYNDIITLKSALLQYGHWFDEKWLK